MKLHKKSLIIALIVILISVSSVTYLCMKSHKATTKPKVSVLSHSDQLSQKEKLDDFEYMYTVLKENYPFFDVNKRMNNVDWLSKKAEYIDLIRTTKNDNEFYSALNFIIKQLNNGHTLIANKSWYNFLIASYPTSDNYCKPWCDQLKNKKTKSRYLDKWKDTPNTNYAENMSEGDDENNNLHTEILIKNKVAYLSITSFLTSYIKKDMSIIKSFLLEVKDYNALIIDIRGNGGGDCRYWTDNLVPLIINKPLSDKQYFVYRGGNFGTEFIKCALGDNYNDLDPIENINKMGLKNLPPEINKDFKYYINNNITVNPNNPVGFKGKIYMLIDKGVYSSAETFATFSKHTGFATLVGKKTGGDGIGQDPLVCSLPNSGYIFDFTYVMGLTSDGSCDDEVKTEPDIKVNDATKAANLNDDKTVQTVLKILKYK